MNDNGLNRIHNNIKLRGRWVIKLIIEIIESIIALIFLAIYIFMLLMFLFGIYAVAAMIGCQMELGKYPNFC
jgi:hypothetical protein